MCASRLSVFVSHNQRDKNTAREIALFLAAEGINVWFDEWKIPAGRSITASVSDALETTTHLILLWSKNARKSNWVRRELFAAASRSVETGKLTLIPVRLDSTPLPTLLRDIKYLTYSTGTELDRFNIVRAITGKNPSEEFTKAITRKYRELTHGGPRGLRACPECGSAQLDWKRFNGFPWCKECGWN